MSDIKFNPQFDFFRTVAVVVIVLLLILVYLFEMID